MTISRFIDKEFTYAAERTTARVISGFEGDELAFYAFEVVKWDGHPGSPKTGTCGQVEDWESHLPNINSRAQVMARFSQHVQARL